MVTICNLPVELGNGSLSFSVPGHGDESVSLLGDVDILDLSALAELILQDGLGAVGVDPVHEKLGHDQGLVVVK